MLTWRRSIPNQSISHWREAITVDLPSLSIWRLLYGFYALLLGPAYGWLGEVPNSFFAPSLLSIGSLFSSLPPARFFQLLDLVVLGLIILVTLGFYTRVSTLLLCLALLTGNHFYYGLGKIDHSILFVVVLPVMAFADWGRYYSIDRLLRAKDQPAMPKSESYDLSLFALFIAFGFFTAGFGKALLWLDFDPTRSGFLGWLFHNYFNSGHRYLLAPLAIQLHPTWIWEFADSSAVIFELGFAVALFRRHWWRSWLIIACGFHLLNCLLLNIPFLAHAIIYLAFVPWLELFPRLRGLDRQTPALLIVAALTCLLLVTVRLQNPENYRSIYQLLTGFHPQSLAFLLTACVIWATTAFILIKTAYHQLQTHPPVRPL